MSLKPYWVKHPWQLRLAAGLALVVSPFIVAWYLMESLWEERDEVVGAYKECWGYFVRGGDKNV